LLAGELILPLRCLMLNIRLPSIGLRALPLLMSAPSLYGEEGVQLLCHRPWWNRHHGLSGPLYEAYFIVGEF
jgi:hypothetical protein